jgi:hypothetical protein
MISKGVTPFGRQELRMQGLSIPEDGKGVKAHNRESFYRFLH